MIPNCLNFYILKHIICKGIPTHTTHNPQSLRIFDRTTTEMDSTEMDSTEMEATERFTTKKIRELEERITNREDTSKWLASLTTSDTKPSINLLKEEIKVFKKEIKLLKEILKEIHKARVAVFSVSPPAAGGASPNVAPVTDSPSPLSPINMALSIYNLYSLEVGGEGNCQFCALAYHILEDPLKHPDVRERVVTELRMHPERYAHFVEAWDVPGSGETLHKKTWEGFLVDMASNGVWGGNTTLVAAANAYGRIVHLVQPASKTAGCISLQTLDPIRKSEGPDIWIAYFNGNHYTATKRGVAVPV